MAESWADDTKNGQDRVQPLIPIAAFASPLVDRERATERRTDFSAADAISPLGELARFRSRKPRSGSGS